MRFLALVKAAKSLKIIAVFSGFGLKSLDFGVVFIVFGVRFIGLGLLLINIALLFSVFGAKVRGFEAKFSVLSVMWVERQFMMPFRRRPFPYPFRSRPRRSVIYVVYLY